MNDVSPEESYVAATDKRRAIIIEIVVALLILCGTSAAVFCIEYFGSHLYPSTPIRVWADTFSISGLLGILAWLLLFVTQHGAFDIIVYGTRKLFAYTFRIHPEKSKLPKTYTDYVLERQAKKPNRFWIYLCACALFFIVGLILVFVSLNLEY